MTIINSTELPVVRKLKPFMVSAVEPFILSIYPERSRRIYPEQSRSIYGERSRTIYSEHSRTMKIAIVGAGFTGLAAAFHLVENNHDVTIFEKENSLGGLSSTVKIPGIPWRIEKHYHHWFTNDQFALQLIKKLGLNHELIFPKSLTSIYYGGKIYPFNSPFHVITFSPLSFFDRVRTGLALLFLKILPAPLAIKMEKYTAYRMLPLLFGKQVFELLWLPLLKGKFGEFAKDVNMTWFWARIKKRTPRLGYLLGGYQKLLEKTAREISNHGGKILLSTPFEKKFMKNFDKVIITAPSQSFIQIFPNLPKAYQTKLKKIKHLHALNLLLVSSKKFLKSTYWLNINEKDYPFIGVIQHTNMIDAKYYGGKHLIWIANYLPPNHPYLNLSKEDLFEVYLPYLKKINPNFNFQFSIFNFQLFKGPFAQPVMPVNYSQTKPDFTTPIGNVYLANMDMVYPWDRGTNYAIELGYKVAEKVLEKN